MALTALKKDKTLSEKAYEIIKTAIIANEFKPGDVLAEEALAEQLSISRTPIRAALKQLQFEHMLEPDNKNLVVSEVTVQDVSNVSVVRCTLETLAASMLENKITLSQIQDLRGITHRQMAVAKKNPGEHTLEYLDYDYQFHVNLARCSGNTFLVDMIERTNIVTLRFLVLSGTLVKYSALAVEEHEIILDHLEQGNVSLATQALHNHIQNVSARMLVF